MSADKVLIIEGRSCGYRIIEIPYRLETAEDVRAAMRMTLPGLEDRHYKAMLRAARELPLEKPDALLKAKPVVKREFFTINKESIRDVVITYEEILSLPLVGQFRLIEASVPWVKEIARQDNLLVCLKTIILRGEALFTLNAEKLSPIKVYEAAITIRRVMKQEILHFARTGHTKELTREELKQTFVAYVLFDPKHADLFEAFKICSKEHREDLYQNAVAELLFQRTPSLLKELTALQPASMRKKLFAKIEGLHLRATHRTLLYGYFPSNAPRDQLPLILNRIDAIVGKATLPDEKKNRLHDYLRSLRQTIDRGTLIYRELFLNGDLEKLQRLHKSVPLLKTVIRYDERIVKTYSKLEALSFYPTRDYLDLCKGIFSNDCVDLRYAKAQLKVPNYFNIRIFEGNQEVRWIGNMYFLDMTREGDGGFLILDRIQIPRELKIYYHHFFHQLKEVLAELFADVDYTAVLTPLAISNHANIQGLYNSYRKILSAKRILFQTPYQHLFESLRGRDLYWILLQKNKPMAATNAAAVPF